MEEDWMKLKKYVQSQGLTYPTACCGTNEVSGGLLIDAGFPEKLLLEDIKNHDVHQFSFGALDPRDVPP